MKSLLEVVNENIWKTMPKTKDYNSGFVSGREYNKAQWREVIDNRDYTYRYVAITAPRTTKAFRNSISPEVLTVLVSLVGYTRKTLENDYAFKGLKDDMLYTDPMFGLLNVDYNTPIESEYYCFYPNQKEDEKPGLNEYEYMFNSVSRLLPQYAKKKYKGMITVEKTEDSVTVHIAKEKGATPEAFVTFERGYYTDEMRRKGIKLPNM